MPDTPKNPADDAAMKVARDFWWGELGLTDGDRATSLWANARFAFADGWRAAMAEVRSRPDGVVAEMTKETHGPIQRDGLYCVYGRCRGFPNSPIACHPGCSFTMSTKAPWDHSREGF